MSYGCAQPKGTPREFGTPTTVQAVSRGEGGGAGGKLGPGALRDRCSGASLVTVPLTGSAVLGYVGARVVPGACARIQVLRQLVGDDGLRPTRTPSRSGNRDARPGRGRSGGDGKRQPRRLRAGVDGMDLLRALSGMCMMADHPGGHGERSRVAALFMDGLRYGAPVAAESS